MFEKTKYLALGLVAVISLAEFADAGAWGGPKIQSTSVSAYSTDVFQIAFVSGQYARILVDGDGDTDLDLYVYDANGNLIDFDDDGTDTCLVEFVPRWSGYFTIKVVNRGSVYNSYTILTN